MSMCIISTNQGKTRLHAGPDGLHLSGSELNLIPVTKVESEADSAGCDAAERTCEVCCRHMVLDSEVQMVLQ
jgi:hypothetical protein